MENVKPLILSCFLYFYYFSYSIKFKFTFVGKHSVKILMINNGR